MEKKRQQKLKQTIRKNYGRIALEESSGGACCAPGCCSSPSPSEAATDVGYDKNELGSVQEASILGVGCGAPVKFADLQKGETVIDLGSGAGIDVFLAANTVGSSGKVSMAHFNPAVTIGFLVSGHIKKSQLPIYLGAEIAGRCLSA